MNIDLWPLLVYTVIVVLLVPGLLVVSALLGQKRKDHATHDVYESGVFPTGSAQLKINVPFYRTAIMFIIFDLEAAFLFAWSISLREVGWLGFVEAFIFIFILVAGLLYLWKSEILKGEGGVVNVQRPAMSLKQQVKGAPDPRGVAHTGVDH